MGRDVLIWSGRFAASGFYIDAWTIDHLDHTMAQVLHLLSARASDPWRVDHVVLLIHDDWSATGSAGFVAQVRALGTATHLTLDDLRRDHPRIAAAHPSGAWLIRI